MSAARRSLRLRPQIAADVPRTAMVMAAGLGKRMRPLTATRPKPLVEVAGKPLIDHVLDRLRAAGVEQAVVNVHYLADALEAHLAANAAGLEVTISDERDLLLETGGGLVQAAPLIDSDPFLVVNSDNFWVDGPRDTLRLLASHWDDERMDALLLLVPQARASQSRRARATSTWTAPAACAAAARRGSRRSSSPASRCSPSGCSRDAPEGPFSTNIFWDRAIAEGRCFGAVHQGLWFDVGTPPAIRATEKQLVRA